MNIKFITIGLVMVLIFAENISMNLSERSVTNLKALHLMKKLKIETANREYFESMIFL